MARDQAHPVRRFLQCRVAFANAHSSVAGDKARPDRTRQFSREWHDIGVISFVIPAHDEAALLGATLDALKAAAEPLHVPFEILVVDDASTDATDAVAVAHGARVLAVAHRHIAATRNAGAGAAAGDVLVFVDADTLVNADVVRAAMAALRNGAVGGGAAVRLAGQPSRSMRLAEAFFIRAFRISRIAPGCFLFCTRSAFDAVGGFDEQWFAGEDVALSRALAKHGRFVILLEHVTTSARKLRTFSVREHLRLMLQFAWRGRSLLKSRSGLELWYGKRR